ncbi:hypothetical protein CC_2086 [Caulobacter vibrioides CB15]|uniref:Uncharacterized protein n=1 Tax=Caulobacter vibrioides (strain ATCC 19089 / CIP 103742 / CB 15) TaxID=190650 RepID=Q9A6K7_CAUVC|nr:hypothetical protein CC_2086 [Caulobacter vibrioides CB15]
MSIDGLPGLGDHRPWTQFRFKTNSRQRLFFVAGRFLKAGRVAFQAQADAIDAAELLGIGRLVMAQDHHLAFTGQFDGVGAHMAQQLLPALGLDRLGDVHRVDRLAFGQGRQLGQDGVLDRGGHTPRHATDRVRTRGAACARETTALTEPR